MAAIGIIGAGEVGSYIARVAIACYQVVLANSHGPETLADLIRHLGRSARATAAEAAEAGDFVVVAALLTLENNLPTDALAGNVVIDTNNYMPWRDSNYPIVDSGEKTTRTATGAASRVQGGQGLHAHPSAADPHLGPVQRLSGPPGADGVQQLSRSGGDRQTPLRSVRGRHGRQQSAQRVLAHPSGSARLEAECRNPGAARSQSGLCATHGREMTFTAPLAPFASALEPSDVICVRLCILRTDRCVPSGRLLTAPSFQGAASQAWGTHAPLASASFVWTGRRPWSEPSEVAPPV